MAERPAWLSALHARQALSSEEFAALLTLAELLAEALGKMHSRYRHDPQCPVCAALARWEAGPRR